MEFSTGFAYKSTRSSPEDFTFDEILSHPVRSQWLEAASQEIESLEAKETWDELPLSTSLSKVLPGTWIFKLKRKPDGTIKKYKARYCVRCDLPMKKRMLPFVGSPLFDSSLCSPYY